MFKPRFVGLDEKKKCLARELRLSSLTVENSNGNPSKKT